MNARLLTRHAALDTASRFRLSSRPAAAPENAAPITSTETLVLLGCGIVAAVGVLLVEFDLKLPGHAILRAVPPLALGLSLVPRRGSGTLMGIGAAATTCVIMGSGLGDKGQGAIVSLSLIGPVLDLAMSDWAISDWAISDRARSARAMPGSNGGRRIYLAFIVAGITANLAAFAFQAAAKYFGIRGGGKPLSAWLPLAIVTYTTFGAVAGLVSAAACFRFSGTAGDGGGDEA